MPFDHYLPATYLARFSHARDPVRRKRLLWAVDKRTGHVFSAPASKLCAVDDFYTVSAKGHDPRFVDSQWGGYEKHLNKALDRLIDGTLEAPEWLSTLVVFVGALLVRGGDFEQRFAERLDAIGPGLQAQVGRDNSNVVRLMEMQRLMAPVIGARWTVLQTSGRVMQITNDLGYTPFFNPARKEAGIAIPVGQTHILLIIPTLKRRIAVARDGTWLPCIERSALEDEQHSLFLQSIAAAAQRYVIGPAEAAMTPYATTQAEAPPVPEPAVLGFFGGAMARHYEHMFPRLVGRLSNSPTESDTHLEVDYEANMPRQ